MGRDDYDDFRMSIDKAPSGEMSVARGSRGAVASVSQEASLLAIEALKDGGNAFDAAFALAFALSVCHPQAGNIGGGGYCIFRPRGASSPLVLNYRERAPLSVRRETYFESGTVDPEKTAFGPLSICVPGTVKAWFTLQKRWGRLSAKDMLLSVADLARKGVRLTEYQACCLNRLRPKLERSPESKAVYVKRGGSFERGDTLANPHLARTLETLASEGERAFYEGRIAEQIAREMETHGGLLTAEDLKSYEVDEVYPLKADVAGTEVWSVPPEGGGAVLIEIVQILDRDEFLKTELFSPRYYHYLAQACKMSFIDRFYYLGEIDAGLHPAFGAVLDRAYTERLFQLITDAKDIPSSELERIMHRGKEELFGDRKWAEGSGGETTHFSVMDSEGNTVSNSYTLNLRYGSKWSVTDAGFLLNGSMDAFSFEEGKPNYFGVIGNRDNLLLPKRRPASNMSPVIVTRGKEIVMALGTPGGPTIQSTLAAVILLILCKTAPDAAVKSARIHHQGYPNVLYKEQDGLSKKTVGTLAGYGYKVEDKSEPIGDVHGIFREADGLMAVSDHRREGYAAAY
ncbi:MAG: gamma-glutamyltransferase [Spirochaetes bacterium]|nr:gamma-glutamyltransferase [Spirochaetota bacterium]